MESQERDEKNRAAGNADSAGEAGAGAWKTIDAPGASRVSRKMPKIPLGIILTAAYFAISGILGMAAGAILISSPAQILEMAKEMPEMEKLLEGITTDYVLTVGIVLAAASALFLLLAWGLLKLRYWARLAAIGVSAALMISALFSYVSGIAFLLQIAAPLIILVYLLQPKTARLFAPATTRHAYGAIWEREGHPENAIPESASEKVGIKCPRCGTEFRAAKNPYGATPIKCPGCGKEGIMP